MTINSEAVRLVNVHGEATTVYRKTKAVNAL